MRANTIHISALMPITISTLAIQISTAHTHMYVHVKTHVRYVSTLVHTHVNALFLEHAGCKLAQFTCMLIHICPQTCLRMSMHTRIRISKHMSAYMPIQMPTQLHMHTHACTHTRMHAQTHAHARTQSRSHARTHARTLTCILSHWRPAQTNFRARYFFSVPTF